MAGQVNALLAEYAESHRNPLNKRIHWICVPAIMLSLLGLLWLLRWPAPASPWLNAAVLLAVLAQVYYLWLSPSLALGMLLLSGAMLALIAGLHYTGYGGWMLYTGIFVAAWIAQFYGHHVEGARPSFTRDLQFLLIGPLWLLAPLYRRLGWHY